MRATMSRLPDKPLSPQGQPSATTHELLAIRQEVAELRRLFDAFAGAFLNAKFPYGKPTDRWPRR